MLALQPMLGGVLGQRLALQRLSLVRRAIEPHRIRVLPLPLKSPEFNFWLLSGNE